MGEHEASSDARNNEHQTYSHKPNAESVEENNTKDQNRTLQTRGKKASIINGNLLRKKEEVVSNSKFDKQQLQDSSFSGLANICVCLNNEPGVHESSCISSNMSQEYTLPRSSLVSIHLNVGNRSGFGRMFRSFRRCEDSDESAVPVRSSSGEKRPIKIKGTLTSNLKRKIHSVANPSSKSHSTQKRNASSSSRSSADRATNNDRVKSTRNSSKSDSSTASPSVYKKSLMQKPAGAPREQTSPRSPGKPAKLKPSGYDHKPVSGSKLFTRASSNGSSSDGKENLRVKKIERKSSDTSSQEGKTRRREKIESRDRSSSGRHQKRSKAVAIRPISSSKSSSASLSSSESDHHSSTRPELKLSKRSRSKRRKSRAYKKFKKDSEHTSSESERRKHGADKLARKILEEHKRRLVELEKKIDQGIMKEISNEFSNLKTQITCLCNRSLGSEIHSPCCSPCCVTTCPRLVHQQRSLMPPLIQSPCAQLACGTDLCCIGRTDLCQNYSDQASHDYAIVGTLPPIVPKQESATVNTDKHTHSPEQNNKPDKTMQCKMNSCIEFYECSLRFGEFSKPAPYKSSSNQQPSQDQTCNRKDSDYSLIKCRASCTLVTATLTDRDNVNDVQAVTGDRQCHTGYRKQKMGRLLHQFLNSAKNSALSPVKTRSINADVTSKQPTRSLKSIVVSGPDRYNEPDSSIQKLAEVCEQRTSVRRTKLSSAKQVNIPSLAEASVSGDKNTFK